MIDIIYKALRLSHFQKLQMMQNIKNVMFQVIFIFSDWILIKQIIVSSNPILLFWEIDFQKNSA